MNSASESKHCPQCGGAIPAEAPQGLCPRCLLAQASLPTEAGKSVSPKPAPPTRDELAAAFPQLEILELIGQGGMGFVFKARQPKLDRFVALKILPQSLAADPAFAERFTREGRVLARLNHPNIVTIHDFGQANGLFYLLMEFVDGVNLRQAMKVGRFTPAQALAVVPKICEALQFAHNEGILHRDIKPENILLDAKGRVKIADFGIAKLVGDVGQTFLSAGSGGFPVARSAAGNTGPEGPVNRQAGKPALQTPALTETGKVLGTPHYMAPEQLATPGDVDHRADIYSLGVVFYEMLTGELPLGRFAPPSEKSAVDPRMDEVVLRTLEKERERRTQTAGEVKTQVETIAATPQLSSSRREEAPSGNAEGGMQNAESSQSLVTSAATNQAPRFSRIAIVGACWAPFFFLWFLWCLVAALHETVAPGGQWPGVGILRKLVWPLVPLVLTAPFGTTILGWVAVSQIRHSAGKLQGMWLAVFDGLLFPLLAVHGLIGGTAVLGLGLAVRSLIGGVGEPFHVPSPSIRSVALFVVLGAIPVDFLIVRRVWQAVNRPLAGGTSAQGSVRRPTRGVLAVVAGFVLLAILAVLPFISWNLSRHVVNPADSPQNLKSLPTDQVIQAGMSKPMSGWAWQELQTRVRDMRLHADEANRIVDGVAAWLRCDYPQGYNQPLFWLGDLLVELNRYHLVGETNVLAFLEAYYGNPFIEPLARIREDEPSLRLRCEWRSSWLNRHSLGFELLNEMASISVDGRQVSARIYVRDRSQYGGTLNLPKLAPGKHIVRCEVESAFVAAREMAGLAGDAPSKDWPPAKRRWRRVCEAEFMVYAQDAEIVSLTEDPALNPVAGGALSGRLIIIRPERGRLTATVCFNVDRRPELPVSVDVTLRLAGQTIKCGKLYAVKTVIRSTQTSAGTDRELTADIGPLDPQIKEAEILLTPNPKAVEEYPYVDRIWGKEIVISHVPLSRQDLYREKPVVTTPVPASMMSFGPVMEQILPDFAAINLASGQVAALPKSVTEQCRIAGNKDAAFAWMEREGLDIVNVGDDGLVGLEMAMPSLKRDDWENCSADALTESLLGRYTSSHFIFGSRFLSNATNHTCAFKTRAGGMGILQITGFTDNPRSVKIRYKLVQAEKK